MNLFNMNVMDFYQLEFIYSVQNGLSELTDGHGSELSYSQS